MNILQMGDLFDLAKADTDKIILEGMEMFSRNWLLSVSTRLRSILPLDYFLFKIFLNCLSIRAAKQFIASNKSQSNKILKTT